MEIRVVSIYFQTFFMALMNMTDPTQKKADIRYIKKAVLKVDMTPMVDLGFLLITFFVFTTEITKPMETLLIMPSKIEDEKVLTALLGKNNKVFVYHGIWEDAVQSGAIYETSYATRDGLGSIIRQKLITLDQRFGPAARKEFMLLIKPAETSTYQNVIDALDEVLINDVKKYAITELTNEEKLYVKNVN